MTIFSLRSLLFLCGAAVAAAITFAVVTSDGDVEFEGEDATSVRHTVRGDSSEFSLREDGLTLKADWRGKLKLDKTGDDIAYVEDYLVIEIEEGDNRESLRLEKDGRGLEATYWRDGNEQEPGDETDAHVHDLILRFLRASGFEAEMRVKKIIEERGVDAALAEIDALSSDYAVRQYVAALSESESLSEENVERLIDKLLRVKGDHDIARALLSIAEHQEFTEATTAALISVSENIDSDYEKRRVLTALADRPLSDAVSEKTITLLSSIDSDHDFRVSMEALLAREDASEDQIARLLDAAAEKLENDHDLRLILTKSATHLADETVANAWLLAFDEISSDYDRRVALEAAALAASDNEALKVQLRDAAETIASEYDRERALKAFE